MAVLMLIRIIGRRFRLRGGERVFFAANAPIILYVIVYISDRNLLVAHVGSYSCCGTSTVHVEEVCSNHLWV